MKCVYIFLEFFDVDKENIVEFVFLGRYIVEMLVIFFVKDSF